MATAAEVAQIVEKIKVLENSHLELKDLFTRAITAQSSQTGGHSSEVHGTARLNFREAERHMPKEYSGKSINFSEYVFKIEAYITILVGAANWPGGLVSPTAR